VGSATLDFVIRAGSFINNNRLDYICRIVQSQRSTCENGNFQSRRGFRSNPSKIDQAEFVQDSAAFHVEEKEGWTK
jgi:hypothetical protein